MRLVFDLELPMPEILTKNQSTSLISQINIVRLLHRHPSHVP